MNVTSARPRGRLRAKAAAVLQTFTPLTTTLSVRQLAAADGDPTQHRPRAVLDARRHRPARTRHGCGYQLGSTLVTLGGHVIDRTGLVAAAEQPLAGLRLRSGQEVHLAQLIESWVVYLDRRAGTWVVPMRNRVGLRVLAHRTGCGRAALAMMNPARPVDGRSCAGPTRRPARA